MAFVSSSFQTFPGSPSETLFIFHDSSTHLNAKLILLFLFSFLAAVHYLFQETSFDVHIFFLPSSSEGTSL